MQRTPLERLFLARVLYCNTCARKIRFLNDGLLRFLGRIEWLLNVYTTCAHCGFKYVVRVPADESSSHDSSFSKRATDALSPPTYRCERCEATYGDYRPSRYSPAEKPATPRPARVVRVADVMDPQGSIDIPTRLSEPVPNLGFAAPSSFGEMSFGRGDEAPALELPWETSQWDAEPTTFATVVIDITPPATPLSTADEAAMTVTTADEANPPFAHVAPIEPISEPSLTFLTLDDLLRPALPAASVADDGPVHATTVNSEPSLDVIRTLPPLDIPVAARPEPPTAAAAEQAARAAAECAKLEALLAAFELHAKSRPRSLAPSPSRPSLPPGPQMPLPASVKSPVPALAN